MGLGSEQQVSASLVNSVRVAAVAERLAAHVIRPSDKPDTPEFFQLCLSLARGIDYALAHNEIPAKAQDLPFLLKQVCRRKNDQCLQAAIMVLMISVKNACNIGWFSDKESQELLSLANEIGTGFSRCGDIRTGPSNLASIISTIMNRFYPQMKMGQILASLEIEPGYGAYMADFPISKNTVHLPLEIRLFVARTDNIETSACIISPQEANFLLNGRGVDRRTNVLMDPGPQMPTNVTTMLKFGTNLLQAVGQFNGHYVIVVAFMTMAPSLDSFSLQDYVQPSIAMQDSDSDIIEGPSRVSLNCPISYTRIRTPVKGYSCKHLQCFDFSNFVNINSRRPSWRCPHCNQHVCYTDIRVDQNMAQVLREVGKYAADVIISADGSWKAVLGSDDNMDQEHDKVLGCGNAGNEQPESPGVPNIGPVILDLTKDENEMDEVISGEAEDRKPILTDIQSQPIAANMTKRSEFHNTVGVNQNVVPQTEDDFWSGILYPSGSASSSLRLDAQTLASVSELASANFMTSALFADAISPAITDSVPHALHREAEPHGYTNLTTSVVQSQCSAPNNMQLQQSQFVNNHEYGRLSVNRHLHRTPLAIQALPAPSQTLSAQQRSGTDLNFFPNGSSLASQALSVGNGFSDLERHQQFSRSQRNAYMGPEMASSSLQHHSASQVLGVPAPSILPGAYRVSSGLSPENLSLNQQQAPNLRMPQSRNLSPRMIQSPSPLSRTSTQQGSAPVGLGHMTGTGSSQHAGGLVATNRAARTATQITRQPPTVPVQVQTSRKGPIQQVNAEGVRASAGEQRVNIGGLVQPVRAESLADLPSEQNWRPAGRMRGSLSGRAYSAALSQFMIQPTQPGQSARPASNPSISLSRPPPHLQALLANRSAHVPLIPNNPTTESAGLNGVSGILPERSLGMN